MLLSSLVCALGCGAEDAGSAVPVERATSALTITSCTGAAISAAVQAGGDVLLSCGPSPVTITVPSTNVTVSGRLHTAALGSVTLTSPSSLFTVQSGVNFEVDNLAFVASSASSMALHGLGGATTVAGSTFMGYQGFAIAVQGGATLGVSNSSFSYNGTPSSSFAAPIYNEGSHVSVVATTFSNNRSGGSGGAITSLGGTLTVVSSTFANNTAGAGAAIYISQGTQSIMNSTFSGNQATSWGGAVAVAAGSPQFQYCTFSNNGSPRGTFTGPATLIDSILVDGISPVGAGCGLGGYGNIQWPTTMPSCGVAFRYGNPLLGALASNGGPTQTMALGVGSAAIDTAIGSCPSSDQRYVTRPRDGDGNGSFICDVGAYER
jgi:predicted outer membrane repeat protein